MSKGAELFQFPICTIVQLRTGIFSKVRLETKNNLPLKSLPKLEISKLNKITISRGRHNYYQFITNTIALIQIGNTDIHRRIAFYGIL